MVGRNGPADSIPVANGDAGQLGQLLQNLVGNARQVPVERAVVAPGSKGPAGR